MTVLAFIIGLVIGIVIGAAAATLVLMREVRDYWETTPSGTERRPRPKAMTERPRRR